MTLNVGEKIHVIARRLYDGDQMRHFAGVVEATSPSQIRVRGYTFLYDQAENEFVRRDEERIRLFSATDAGLIINVLPPETEVVKLHYQLDEQGRRVVTDGKAVSLNVSEFGANR
ncbi:MAG: hypothetical protein WBR18_10605 [Anaerolineales bacterium]